MRSFVTFIAFILLAALITSACSIDVKDAAGGDSNRTIPSKADMQGDPADFKGQWEGNCIYVMENIKRTDCRAILKLRQDSALSGSVTYTVGNASPINPFQLRRMIVDGNDLMVGSLKIGSIGKAGFRFEDENYGNITVKLLQRNSIILNIDELPTPYGATDCTTGICFTSSLTRVSF